MGLYSTKRLTQQIFQPATRRMIAANLSPDWLTGGAVLLALMAGIALLNGWWWLFVICAPLRLLLNVFDGEVARGLGVANQWGEVKNEMGDILADALIFGALTLTPFAPLWLKIAVLVIVLLSEFAGVLAKALTGQRAYGGMMGKPDRMFSLVAACIVMALTGWHTIFTLTLLFILVLEIQTVYVRLEALHDR